MSTKPIPGITYDHFSRGPSQVYWGAKAVYPIQISQICLSIH